jgi:hypothetical protein
MPPARAGFVGIHHPPHPCARQAAEGGMKQTGRTKKGDGGALSLFPPLQVQAGDGLSDRFPVPYERSGGDTMRNAGSQFAPRLACSQPRTWLTPHAVLPLPPPDSDARRGGNGNTHLWRGLDSESTPISPYGRPACRYGTRPTARSRSRDDPYGPWPGVLSYKTEGEVRPRRPLPLAPRCSRSAAALVNERGRKSGRGCSVPFPASTEPNAESP